MNGWREQVLEFWFEELSDEDRFSGKAEVDEAVRTRFGPLVEKMSVAAPAEAYDDAVTALAAIIVYDQFPRNIYRHTPTAFSTDALAIEIARNALDKAFDAGMDDTQRQFLYMPFMHSEVMADQERCVDLFKSLSNPDAVRFAEEHRDIIARFGRFPHRNKVLDRNMTPEEAEFLRSHQGFGQ